MQAKIKKEGIHQPDPSRCFQLEGGAILRAGAPGGGPGNSVELGTLAVLCLGRAPTPGLAEACDDGDAKDIRCIGRLVGALDSFDSP
jgi:hypothetical protein